jgi:hypothetical protein
VISPGSRPSFTRPRWRGFGQAPATPGPGSAERLIGPSGDWIRRRMHPAYFDIAFDPSGYQGPWPASFAIVTAWAPTGTSLPIPENQRRDLHLRERLCRCLGTQPVRITGFSPTTGHAEPGWLVPLARTPALNIGLDYQQDAIYWIQFDQLSVVHCSPSLRIPIPMGWFRERLITPFLSEERGHCGGDPNLRWTHTARSSCPSRPW